MLLLNLSNVFIYFLIPIISIHLMLLLNFDSLSSSTNTVHISIHLMLLLNIIHQSMFDNHHQSMFDNHCNFNTSYVVIKPAPTILWTLLGLYFNTSYVVIKRNLRKCTYDIYHISIHLMLLLNYRLYQIHFRCFRISIHLMLLLNFL